MKKVLLILGFSLVNFYSAGMDTYAAYKENVESLWINEEHPLFNDLKSVNSSTMSRSFKEMPQKQYDDYRAQLDRVIRNCSAYVERQFKEGEIDCPVCSDGFEGDLAHEKSFVLSCGHQLHSVCEHQYCTELLKRDQEAHHDTLVWPCICPSCKSPYPIQIFLVNQLSCLQQWLEEVRPLNPGLKKEHIKNFSYFKSYVVCLAVVPIAIIGYKLLKYKNHKKV